MQLTAVHGCLRFNWKGRGIYYSIWVASRSTVLRFGMKVLADIPRAQWTSIANVIELGKEFYSIMYLLAAFVLRAQEKEIVFCIVSGRSGINHSIVDVVRKVEQALAFSSR